MVKAFDTYKTFNLKMIIIINLILLYVIIINDYQTIYWKIEF